MKPITILFPALICVLCLTGCVPAPGASGPGRPIAAYIADDVTKAEITHRAGGTVTEWTAEGEELDALRDWASGLKYELLDSEENPGDRDGGEVYEVVLTEGYYPGFSYVICGPDDCYLLIEGYWYSVTNPSDPPAASPADRGAGTLDVSKYVVKGADGEAAELTEEDAEILTQLLSGGAWAEGTTDCASDCTVGLDGRWFRYHSECGTFNEITIPGQPQLSSVPPPSAEGRSLRLADAERAAVNAVLEKYITLGPGIVENVG